MLTYPQNEPRVLFHTVTSSWTGDWNLGDNILRALLATPTYGLAAAWVRFNQWKFDRVTAGYPLYEAQLANNIDTNINFGRSMELLGDPTLRYPVLAPVDGLSATLQGGIVALNWKINRPDFRFLILRSSNAYDGLFELRGSTGATSFSEVKPAGVACLYAVRAAGLHDSGAGSSTNLSQARFILVP